MNYGKRGVKKRLHYINPIAGKLGKKCFTTALQLLLASFLVIMVTLVCTAFGMVKGIIETSPEISPLDTSPTGYKTVIYDVNGQVTEELIGAEANRVFVTLDQISPNLQNAIIAIEDERFYKHNGIDPKGILRAASIAIKSGELDQGASTITQQLIKNTVFNAFNESTSEKIKRKIREQYLAIKLEEQTSKEKILEDYLNTINFGNGNFGIQAAAQNYFNKNASELTISESALIAGITQRPQAYNPVKFPQANKKRRKMVLDNMLRLEYITKAEYDEAMADDVYSRIQNIHSVPEETTAYSYFVDELVKQIKEDLITQKGYTKEQADRLIFKGGLSIMSTQDMKIQAIVNEEFANPVNYPASTKVGLEYHLMVTKPNGTTKNYSATSLQYHFINKTGNKSFDLIFDSKEDADAHIAEFREAMIADGSSVTYENIAYVMQPQASMTIMDQKTGQVKAIIGGRGEKTASLTFNRATEATRQPGSTFKVITTYGPAIDLGKITLATVLDDAPYHYKDGKLVSNHENNYLGLMSARYAIAVSRNIPAVKTLSLITPQVGLNYALDFGFTTLVTPENMINGNHDMVESLCLGGLTHGVTNLELCAAYATIANGGVYNEPIFYTVVYDHDGNILLDNSHQESHRVIKESTSEILVSALQSVTKLGTGQFSNVKTQPVAGKTGTTNSDVDKWYVAFTPYYTGAIWYGYDDNTPYNGNAIMHVQLWGKIFTRIHEGLPRGEFTMSNKIVEQEICSQSGKLAVEGVCDKDPRGSQIVTEYFIKGTEPTAKCDVHTKVEICKDTNQIATTGCKNKETKIYIQKSNTSTFTIDFSEKYPEDLSIFVHDSKYVLPKELTNCIKHAAVADNPDKDKENDKDKDKETEKSTEKETEKSTDKETEKSTEKETETKKKN